MLPLSRLIPLCAAVVLCAASPALASYSSEVAMDNPAGYWHLESVPPSGSPISSDVGSRLAGFNAPGATSVPGLEGNAAHFDGNEAFGVQAQGASVPAFTFEALFNLDALPAPGANARLFDSTSQSGNAIILAVTASGDLGIFSGLDGLGPQLIGGNIQPHAWHHVAMSRNATDINVYLDGALVGHRTASGIPLAPGPAPFGFAHTYAGGPGTERIVGLMDEPALYDVALAPGRISAHALAATGSPPVPNHPPTCAQSTRLIAQNTPTSIGASCSDADGDTLGFGLPSFVTQQGGSLSAGGPSSVTYTPPNATFTGPDQFDFTVGDGHVTVTFTAQLYVYPTGATAQVAPAGGTVSSPAPTPAAPLAASVTTPDGGVVTITPVASGSPPLGYELIDGAVQIKAPDASGSPLHIVLRTASTASPLVPTRDGVTVADCTATPVYPCVSARRSVGGLQEVEILSDHASTWQLVTPGKPGKGCGDKNHAHLDEAGCKKLK
jgi:hypothetical protein